MNLRFENDVKTYSIQTENKELKQKVSFENDVKTYSIQTPPVVPVPVPSLRMM